MTVIAISFHLTQRQLKKAVFESNRLSQWSAWLKKSESAILETQKFFVKKPLPSFSAGYVHKIAVNEKTSAASKVAFQAQDLS